jgi:putative restriction endonuclease
VPALQHAAINGIASHRRGNRELAIAFRPDFFLTYVSNHADLHAFGRTANDSEALSAVMNPERNLTEVEVSHISTGRQKVARLIHQNIRDVGFRNRVLSAYDHHCAFCGIQLKLVDAAHIIPAATEDNDRTTNGIALCPTHHRAYDAALLSLDRDYRIRLSQSKRAYLESIARGGGFDGFRQNLLDVIYTPRDPTLRPDPAFIIRANEVRKWRP